MRWIFAAVLVLHGLLHLMGFARAFGLAELPQLTQSISRLLGVAWLATALALLATAGLLLAGNRWWWAVGVTAVVLSQTVIITSWSDARLGTVANVLVLAGVVYGFASQGPLGFRSEYRRQVGEHLARTVRGDSRNPGTPGTHTRGTLGTPLTEDDLAPLPRPVRRYIRHSGAVGQSRVTHFAAAWKGRIRAASDDPWMPFTARQHNFVDEPARFFLMDARRGGLPVDVLHVFRDGAASMRVRLLSLIPLVRARGPELTRAETVTLLNDLCVLAPGALIDPAIVWEEVDARSARAIYTLGDATIGAVLHFDDAGELVDFVSDDRLAASPDGRRFTRRRWSTPLRDYRSFGPWRASGRGEGRWHTEEDEFAYIELELLELRINGRPPS